VTTTSGTPEQPERPGPDATPEQEAFVTALLGGLRADDPPMPEHVVARLDAVLAEERRTYAAGTTGAGTAPLADRADEGSTGAGSAEPAVAPVTVLPQRRRPERSTTAVQWLVGAAAAVLVVGGVGAVVRGTFGGSSADLAASSAGGPTTSLLATGTAYDEVNLATQVRSLVAAPTTDQGSTAAPEVASGDVDGPSAPDRSAGALTTDTLAGCLEELTGAPGTDPLAVDQATYEGRPALVVVLVSTDDPASLDVWVVAPTCTRAASGLIRFERVPRS
jgi:hypothetical protein